MFSHRKSPTNSRKQREKKILDYKKRLCLHGNKKELKLKVKKNADTAQFYAVMLLLRFTAVINFKLGCSDIRRAYLQSDPAK